MINNKKTSKQTKFKQPTDFLNKQIRRRKKLERFAWKVELSFLFFKIIGDEFLVILGGLLEEEKNFVYVFVLCNNKINSVNNKKNNNNNKIIRNVNGIVIREVSGHKKAH